MKYSAVVVTIAVMMSLTFTEAKIKEIVEIPEGVFLTRKLCSEKKYKKLHTCKLLKKGKAVIDSLTEPYSCMFTHYNESTIESLQPAEVKKRDIIKNPDGHLVRRDSFYASLLEYFGISTSVDLAEQDTLLRNRVARQSSGAVNPCDGGLVTAVVYYAEAVDDSETYELFHNPDEGLYQTFSVQQCLTPNYSSFTCESAPVVVKTLVYLYPPDIGDELAVKLVKIPSVCALYAT